VSKSQLQKRYVYYIVVQSQVPQGIALTCGEVFIDKPIAHASDIISLTNLHVDAAKTSSPGELKNPIALNYILLRVEDVEAEVTK